MVSVRKASKRFLSKLSTISKQRESDAYKRQLKRKNVDITNDAIRLSYGPEMGAVLNEGGVVTGGKVKLTHLHEQYPHQETRFNILYLVSSALPKHAVMLVRWAKNYGVKVVLNQNGVAYPGWTDDYQAINAELQEILTASDLVLYQSRFCKESADRFAGKPTARWEIVNNCVDIEHFKPSNRQGNGSIMLLVAGTHRQRERVVLPLYILNATCKSCRGMGYSTASADACTSCPAGFSCQEPSAQPVPPSPQWQGWGRPAKLKI